MAMVYPNLTQIPFANQDGSFIQLTRVFADSRSETERAAGMVLPLVLLEPCTVIWGARREDYDLVWL